MHRRHASPIFLLGVAVAACGGRIAQGDKVDSQNDSPTPTPTPTPTSSPTTTPTSAPPQTIGACGVETCAADQECCVGGLPKTNAADTLPSLETCVPNGTCNTGLLDDCGTGDACETGEICCVTVNPTTGWATAGCALTCGGNGLPAVQVCASDADCPSGSTCFTAAIGPNGEGETMRICGGVR